MVHILKKMELKLINEILFNYHKCIVNLTSLILIENCIILRGSLRTPHELFQIGISQSKMFFISNINLIIFNYI